ncbi:hypothetical protein [Nocardia sp. XZ_19_369]|uniref:hypothetical protein n=1 Tax=Nocardia sp. XZ_19_369 TaxID=2769487 RepID=UPI00188E08DE|nr:hypothetical protein [Nocardia sp. XZ_19_369]
MTPSRTPDHGAEPDQPTPAPDDASGVDSTDLIPEWAPGAPLPCSETLLAAFAGVRSILSSIVIDAAVDLVTSQRQYRRALQRLTDWPIEDHRLKAMGSQLISARDDRAALTAAIDDAVGYRQRQRAAQPSSSQTVRLKGVPAGTPTMVVQTESIGRIVARMADLWGLIVNAAETDEVLPEWYTAADCRRL